MTFAATGAFIASYAGVIAAGVAAAGAIAAADAQRRAMHTQADIAKQKGQIAMDQANVNEDAQRRRGAIYSGQAAAAAAEGSGLSGTNVDVIKQGDSAAELDALNIRYSGKLGKLSGDEQAGFDNMAASDAQTAGYFNAASSALSAYGSYTRGQRKTGTGLS